MNQRTPVVAATLFLLSTPGLADKLEPDDLAGPAPEVAPHTAKIDLPAMPAFELPPVAPGAHSARELRVRGKSLLGSELKVEGYVTAIYDCIAALAVTNPKATRAQIVASVDKNPALCEPAKLYLGDRKDTARERSIWVVDVPRAPGKAERQRMSRAELAALPPVPRLAVGDYVAVTGTWNVQSPHHEHNGDGLLIYQALDRATPPDAGAAPVAASPAPEPEVAVVTRPPLRAAVDPKVRAASVAHASQCYKEFEQRHYDPALAACRSAVQTWPGNHLAWYASASAHMAKDEWPAAQADVEHAVALRPDLAMYQLYDGIAKYEAERARIRDELAQRDHKTPDEVTINPALLKLEPAKAALARAAVLDPALWRAHFYLSRVYRDLDDPRREAEQLAQTIATHPAYRFGYLALSDLYRRWDAHDAAIAVALRGTAQVAPADAPELWFAAGLSYEAKHADDQAIDAFSKMIAGVPDDASAKLHRAQSYLRKAALADAKRDLDAVIASSDPRAAALRPVAVQLLAQIARRQ
ncbi:MAG TPA: hypothetical protein VH165_30890 [Kofleriaceae bacterium]|nr:hypothetical protein [Kofleriaceae bacterium]